MDKRKFHGLNALSGCSSCIPDSRAPTIPTHAINNRVTAPTGMHHPVHGGYPSQLPMPNVHSELPQPEATRLPIDSTLRNPFSLGDW